MSDTAIRTIGLSCRFGSFDALQDVSLDVPHGSVFGLLGPNGAGKTTMIRALLGLVEPTAGSAEVLGLDTRRKSSAIRERVGALLEHTGLYERLSAYDNLDLFARIARMSAPARHQRVRELLEQLRLWERRRESVGTWSRGMKQRLAIARAMMARPELVFLDEPTAGLDPMAARELRNELTQLVANHQTTLFITTHNLNEAERLCDTVAVLHRGRLLACGSPAQLAASGSLEDSFTHLVEAAC
jgi:ABC-2 type transport system ATP-binding protein